MKLPEHRIIQYTDDYAKHYHPFDSITKSPFKVGDDVVICKDNNSLILLRSLQGIDYLCPFCHKQLNADLIIIDNPNEGNKPDKKPLPSSRRLNTLPVFWTGLTATLFFCFIFTVVVIFAFIIRKPISAGTDVLIVSTFTSIPSPTSAFTNTPAITSTPTPFPDEVTNDFGVSMRLIPDGEFTMGRNGGFKDERPVHTVYLESYYIDKYEVTNILYEACVNNGVCTPPQNIGSGSSSSYYGNPEFSNYPVIYVDWYQSKTYCEWRGARLPTEAEWEKAARGTNERYFPWGNNFQCRNGNFDDIIGLNGYVITGGPNCDGYENTSPVGSFENGKSPFGTYDMVGNVWEWVSDWYDGNYYADSLYQDPQGPSSGNGRVIRGGAWDVANIENLFTTRHIGFEPSTVGDYLGFRCASSLP